MIELTQLEAKYILRKIEVEESRGGLYDFVWNLKDKLTEFIKGNQWVEEYNHVNLRRYKRAITLK